MESKVQPTSDKELEVCWDTQVHWPQQREFPLGPYSGFVQDVLPLRPARCLPSFQKLREPSVGSPLDGGSRSSNR